MAEKRRIMQGMLGEFRRRTWSECFCAFLFSLCVGCVFAGPSESAAAIDRNEEVLSVPAFDVASRGLPDSFFSANVLWPARTFSLAADLPSLPVLPGVAPEHSRPVQARTMHPRFGGGSLLAHSRALLRRVLPSFLNGAEKRTATDGARVQEGRAFWDGFHAEAPGAETQALAGAVGEFPSELYFVRYQPSDGMPRFALRPPASSSARSAPEDISTLVPRLLRLRGRASAGRPQAQAALELFEAKQLAPIFLRAMSDPGVIVRDDLVALFEKSLSRMQTSKLIWDFISVGWLTIEGDQEILHLGPRAPQNDPTEALRIRLNFFRSAEHVVRWSRLVSDLMENQAFLSRQRLEENLQARYDVGALGAEEMVNQLLAMGWLRERGANLGLNVLAAESVPSWRSQALTSTPAPARPRVQEFRNALLIRLAQTDMSWRDVRELGRRHGFQRRDEAVLKNVVAKLMGKDKIQRRRGRYCLHSTPSDHPAPVSAAAVALPSMEQVEVSAVPDLGAESPGARIRQEPLSRWPGSVGKPYPIMLSRRAQDRLNDLNDQDRKGFFDLLSLLSDQGRPLNEPLSVLASRRNMRSLWALRREESDPTTFLFAIDKRGEGVESVRRAVVLLDGFDSSELASHVDAAARQVEQGYDYKLEPELRAPPRAAEASAVEPVSHVQEPESAPGQDVRTEERVSDGAERGRELLRLLRRSITGDIFTLEEVDAIVREANEKAAAIRDQTWGVWSLDDIIASVEGLLAQAKIRELYKLTYQITPRRNGQKKSRGSPMAPSSPKVEQYRARIWEPSSADRFKYKLYLDPGMERLVAKMNGDGKHLRAALEGLASQGSSYNRSKDRRVMTRPDGMYELLVPGLEGAAVYFFRTRYERIFVASDPRAARDLRDQYYDWWTRRSFSRWRPSEPDVLSVRYAITMSNQVREFIESRRRIPADYQIIQRRIAELAAEGTLLEMSSQGEKTHALTDGQDPRFADVYTLVCGKGRRKNNRIIFFPDTERGRIVLLFAFQEKEEADYHNRAAEPAFRAKEEYEKLIGSQGPYDWVQYRRRFQEAEPRR